MQRVVFEVEEGGQSGNGQERNNSVAGNSQIKIREWKKRKESVIYT